MLHASPLKVRQMVHHPAEERRLAYRVFRHWHEMTSGRRFPSTLEIDPWLVGADWESCFLIRLRKGQEATFLMVGAALLPDAGGLSNTSLSSCAHPTPSWPSS
jgi:hypothetical protein